MEIPQLPGVHDTQFVFSCLPVNCKWKFSQLPEVHDAQFVFSCLPVDCG